MEITTAFVAVAFLLVGIAVGYLTRRYWAARRLGDVEEKVKKSVAEAETKAKEIIIEAKDKAASFLVDIKNEEKERRKELEAVEARLTRKEETLDKRSEEFQAEEGKIRAREEKIKSGEEALAKKEAEVEARLTKIGGLSAADAREEIIQRVKEDRAQDLAQFVQKMDKENHDEIEKKAGEIITTALQRYSRSHVSEITTTLFPLGDDELKGKIIGREGRNIRALERATGVEFIIDEAPEAIIISSFDPYRREVARLALEWLIKDGRIQPAKIEEAVEEAKSVLTKRTHRDRRGGGARPWHL